MEEHLPEFKRGGIQNKTDYLLLNSTRVTPENPPKWNSPLEYTLNIESVGALLRCLSPFYVLMASFQTVSGVFLAAPLLSDGLSLSGQHTEEERSCR